MIYKTYLTIGEWSIGEGGKRIFLFDEKILINNDFIGSYHFDTWGYPSFFEQTEMPTVQDAISWILPQLERNENEKRTRKFEERADKTARKILEFLKKQDHERQVSIC